jgi:hypothetical protein
MEIVVLEGLESRTDRVLDKPWLALGSKPTTVLGDGPEVEADRGGSQSADHLRQVLLGCVREVKALLELDQEFLEDLVE